MNFTSIMSSPTTKFYISITDFTIILFFLISNTRISQSLFTFIRFEITLYWCIIRYFLKAEQIP